MTDFFTEIIRPIDINAGNVLTRKQKGRGTALHLARHLILLCQPQVERFILLLCHRTAISTEGYRVL